MTNIEKVREEYEEMSHQSSNPGSIVIAAAIRDLTDAVRENSQKLEKCFEDLGDTLRAWS